MKLSTPPAGEVAWWCEGAPCWVEFNGRPRVATQGCEVRAQTWSVARERGLVILQCEPWEIEVALRAKGAAAP